MAFYENTIVAKQDLAEKDLKILKDKYNVGSISAIERRDLQQIILKKHEITENDQDLLKKLSSKQD